MNSFRLRCLSLFLGTLAVLLPQTSAQSASIAPVITTQPTSLTLTAGAKASFSVLTTGTPAPAFQWFKNGRVLERATAASLTLDNVGVEDAAVYTVKVSNPGGSVTSTPASLAVNLTAGTITTAPLNVNAQAGSDAKFTVVATGTGLTYRWRFNGRVISGETGSTLTVTNVGANSDGLYSVTVSTSSGLAAVATAALTLTFDARLTNISTRGHVGADEEVLITGFVIRGGANATASTTKKIVLRAVGPTLGTQFQVADALVAPKLTLYSANRNNTVVDTNSGWGGSAALAAAFVQVGAFPLSPTSADAALIETLGSGAYTAQVTAPDTSSGVALAEIYDDDLGSPPTEIINISTRALVGAEVKDTLIAGFAISGTTSDTVIVRGVGPSLGTLFGLRRALGASHLAVFDSKGNQIAANTTWAHHEFGDRDDHADDNDRQDDIDAACDRVGAWRLPRGSTDSALLLTLPPGVYTAHVTGVNGKSGIGLVEIYEVH